MRGVHGWVRGRAGGRAVCVCFVVVQMGVEHFPLLNFRPNVVVVGFEPWVRRSQRAPRVWFAGIHSFHQFFSSVIFYLRGVVVCAVCVCE